MHQSYKSCSPPVGIGFRPEAYEATLKNLERFDVLEIMVDHYISGTHKIRERILDLSSRIPVVGHGVGLSIGTAVPPDEFYLDQVAEVLELIRAPWHSEHLAFTKVPGRDLAQLLPIPRTVAAAECVIHNLEIVRKHIPKPFALENITYYFEYSDCELSEQDFIQLICRESGALLLLDLENVYLNATNHGYDAFAFIDSFPKSLVKGVHVAGGTALGALMLDSHDRPVPNQALELLKYLLRTQTPDSIVLERDERLDDFDEVLEDIGRLKAAVSAAAA
ncbi:MAG: DUF692 domain-containing protein [Bryobacteraceae bacterium]